MWPNLKVTNVDIYLTQKIFLFSLKVKKKMKKVVPCKCCSATWNISFPHCWPPLLLSSKTPHRCHSIQEILMTF